MFITLYNFLVEKLGVNMTYEIKDFLRNSPPIERKVIKNDEDEESVLMKRVRHRKYTI